MHVQTPPDIVAFMHNCPVPPAVGNASTIDVAPEQFVPSSPPATKAPLDRDRLCVPDENEGDPVNQVWSKRKFAPHVPPE